MRENQSRYTVVSIGEILIDFVATTRAMSLASAAAFVPAPGGAPANVAVGVQRLGQPAAFIGKVGIDEFGQSLRALLVAEGVATTNLIDDPDHCTTLAFVALDATGDPHFTFAAGAHTTLRLAEIDQTMVRDARIVHAGSVALAHEPVRTTTHAVLTQARVAGAICSYDVNWRPALWVDPIAGLALAREPLAMVDICKMNGAELRLLTGERDPAAGLQALATTATLVVVTLGAQGCLFRHRDAIHAVAAPPAGQIVDTIGAGDAFMAALLASLPAHPATLTSAEIATILARACRAGAISVTRHGGIPSLPFAEELP